MTCIPAPYVCPVGKRSWRGRLALSLASSGCRHQARPGPVFAFFEASR